MYLSWSEQAWWLKGSPDVLGGTTMLGEARNVPGSTQAMRFGDEVLVYCNFSIPKKLNIIPANITVKGFGDGKDGRTLAELMEEETLYNYLLNKEVSIV